MYTNVNLPNIGQVSGLPMGAIVETNAVFERDSLRPVFAGRLPDRVNLLVRRHAYHQQLLVEAGIRKDTELAFNVFLDDNLMTLDLGDARCLFKEMFSNTSAYLDSWDVPAL